MYEFAKLLLFVLCRTPSSWLSVWPLMFLCSCCPYCRWCCLLHLAGALMDWVRAATSTVSTHTHTHSQPYVSPESKRDTMWMPALFSFSILELQSAGPRLQPCTFVTFHPRVIVTYFFALTATTTGDQELFAHSNTRTDKVSEVLISNPYLFSVSHILC